MIFRHFNPSIQPINSSIRRFNPSTHRSNSSTHRLIHSIHQPINSIPKVDELCTTRPGGLRAARLNTARPLAGAEACWMTAICHYCHNAIRTGCAHSAGPPPGKPLNFWLRVCVCARKKRLKSTSTSVLEFWFLKSLPGSPKMPRQMHPKGIPTRPKRSQHGPKLAQDMPRCPPRCPQDLPRPS